MKLGDLRLAIIGAGNLGLSLASKAEQSSISVALGVRRIKETQAIMGRLDFEPSSIDSVMSANQAVQNADLVFICVQDEAIEQCCIALSKHLAKNATVIHFSGSLNSTSLNSVRDHGCSIASAHPLNSFPSAAAGIRLLANSKHDTHLFCEGDSQALTRITPLFERWGFHVQKINIDDKALYHCAAVIACNYLTTLMDNSLRTAELAGIETEVFWPAILPLVQTTLRNINEHGAVGALSGPIARGDSATIESHIGALRSHTELTDLYKHLGELTVDLATRAGNLSEQQARQIKHILNDESHKPYVA